jgi:transposase-like protein
MGGSSKLARYTHLREYRGLSAVEKAVKLIQERQSSIREAAGATGADPSAVFRAKKALKENRAIGVAGRPKVLGIEGEASLLEAIKEADEKRKSLTYQQLRDRVSCMFRNIFLVFQCISPRSTHFKLHI